MARAADGSGDPEAPAPGGPIEPRHRADYLLQRGVWHVRCRVCGWHAEGVARRQLASLYRFHLRADPGAKAKPSEKT